MEVPATTLCSECVSQQWHRSSPSISSEQGGNGRSSSAAPSLGGPESLIEQPTVVSYWDQTPEARAAVGIRDNLVRFSVGLENYDDIEADLLQALDQV